MAASNDPVTLIEGLLAELGLGERVSRVSDHVWALRKGSATIQLVAATDFVVATAKMCDALPPSGPAREAFLTTLLTTNVQLCGAFFTLEENGSVRLNQVIPLEWLQKEELAFVISNVARRADEWDDKLQALVSARP
jgi:hypothetical protein